MKTIKQTYTIKAPLSEVWKALVEPEYIEGWGGGPAKMDDNVGTEFSLWGGEIWGKNIEVLHEKKLVQEWFSKDEGDWSKPSVATFNLKKEGDATILDFLHTNVPDEAAKNIDEGWKKFYLGPLKEYLERNSK